MRKRKSLRGAAGMPVARGAAGVPTFCLVTAALLAGCQVTEERDLRDTPGMPEPAPPATSAPRPAVTVVQHLRSPQAPRLRVLNVPTGARLGLVARAASTSVETLLSLNPELQGPPPSRAPHLMQPITIPEVPGVQAAQALMRLLQNDDALDQCVDDDFDWGAQTFTSDMRELCDAELSMPSWLP